MKEMKKMSLELILIMAIILLAGCSKDDDSSAEPEKEITYSVTYSVSKISEDFFACGTVMVVYADKDGKEQVIELKKSNMPFAVTLEGLMPDDKLYFDLFFGYNENAELTKEQYTFAEEASYTLVGTDGSRHASTLASGSVTMAKDKVADFMLRLIDREFTLDTTVGKLLSNK